MVLAFLLFLFVTDRAGCRLRVGDNTVQLGVTRASYKARFTQGALEAEGKDMAAIMQPPSKPQSQGAHVLG